MSKKNQRKEEHTPDFDPSCMEVPSRYYQEMVPREYQKTHYIFFLEEIAGEGVPWIENILFSGERKNAISSIRKKRIGGRDYSGFEITGEELKVINSIPKRYAFVIQKKQ